jgi:sporulation protein YlmC with PRC-barrel domain
MQTERIVNDGSALIGALLHTENTPCFINHLIKEGKPMIKSLVMMIGASILAASFAIQADMDAKAQYEYRASQLIGTVIGADVVNRQGERVGRIDDLLIDADGTITHAVLSVGGFLGLGDHLVAVPFPELEIAVEEDDLEVTYDVSEDELKAKPEFEYL